MALSYHYSGQLRKYVQQVIRVFSSFYVLLGKDAQGRDQFFRVPCTYGDPSRMAMHIMRQNSENTTIPVPAISCYISNVEPAADRRQMPNFVGELQVSERKYDEEENEYLSKSGSKLEVNRFMPVPINLSITVDVWTSNTEHRAELFEQIVVLFNPDLDIQTSTNPLDWSAKTILELTDMTWNTRSVPQGLDESISIMSFSFKIPAWINPPAKVKLLKNIHQIVINNYFGNSIQDGLSTPTTFDEGNTFFDYTTAFDINVTNGDALEKYHQQIITPGNHKIKVENNVITLLNEFGGEHDKTTGDILDWSALLEKYGELRENTSRIRLKPIDDLDNSDFDYIGRISLHPTEKNKLYWIVDLETIPADSLNPVDAVIDPHKSIPNYNLPTPVIGTRFLLVDDIGGIASATQGWGNLIAKSNDIIEFNGTSWSVVFDSANNLSGFEYISNSYSGKKYKWNGEEWLQIPDGIWEPGFWRIYL